MSMTDTERYALGLQVEEMGEALQLIGKALRFGLDTPGFIDPVTGVVDYGKTPRNMLPLELGDVMAALAYAAQRHVLQGAPILQRRDSKLAKLLSPESKDNLGRRLAP